MDKIVNVALQVLPVSDTVHPYVLVDSAIAVIVASGLKYRVTPFETVMEGTYAQIMDVVEKAQIACYEAGAKSVMAYVKIQSSVNDVCIEDKTAKYE